MKRILLFWVLVVAVSTAVAQKGYNVNSLFDGRYRKSPNAVEVVVTGVEAAKIKLTKYRSLSVADDADAAKLIEELVVKDGVKAVDKEVEYRGGRLYYGFYTLTASSLKDKERALNRYLFYLNQNLNSKNPENKVIVIYMEGWAKADYIKSLIRN